MIYTLKYNFINSAKCRKAEEFRFPLALFCYHWIFQFSFIVSGLRRVKALTRFDQIGLKSFLLR